MIFNSANCGIYEIACSANGKRYVGSAMFIDKRWREHRRDLVRGSHHSPYLQRAWAKYGSSAFEFRILEAHVEIANLFEREKYHMESAPSDFNCYPVRGMRLVQMVDNGEFVRSKMRAAKVGKPSVKRDDPTMCAKKLHAWIEGARECAECERPRQKAYHLSWRRSRGTNPRRLDPTKCKSGKHEWIEGATRCAECERDYQKTYGEGRRVVDPQPRTKPQSNSSTGIRGLTWDAARDRWKAQIKVNGERVQRRFESREEAEAFISAARM